MIKRFGAVLLVMLFLISLIGCGNAGNGGATTSPATSAQTASSDPAPSFSGEPIKIGHAVALTGDASVFGQSEATGLELAVKAVNEAGGILGREVVLVKADTRADPAETVNAVRRLVDQEKVHAIIGVAQSGVAMSATPIVTAAKIPMISTTSSNPYVTINKETGALNKYVFRVCFIDPYQGTATAQYAFKELGVKNAAILYDVGSDYSQWLATYFEEAFIAAGGTITGKEAYRTGELDFRAPLGKIKETSPELLFLPVTQKDAALICKQARDIKIESIFMGGDNWASPDILSLGKEAVEGAYFINLASFDDPRIKGWVEENKSAFKGDVVRNAILAYDAMLWLADSIERAGSTDGEKIATELENTKDLEVLTTDSFNVDPATHNPLDRAAYIMTIENNAFKYVMTFAPAVN